MSGMQIGFRFIPFPLAIVDDGADLSLGEFRLLAYLLRHRFRAKSNVLRLTQEDLLRGVRGASGDRRDRGCQITSGRDLKLARERLVARGWLRVDIDAADGSFVYELNLEDETEESEGASAKCTDATASAKCSSGECEMLSLPVQNAPAYKEEKVKKREERQKPSHDVESGAPSPVLDIATARATATAATEPVQAATAWGEGGDDTGLSRAGAAEDASASSSLVLVSPSKAKRKGVTDGRHVECQEFCRRYASSRGVEFVWDGSEGKALSLLLAAAPGLTVERFAESLRNRARSPVAHGERPRVWLPTLGKFQDGPLDRFGVPQGGNNVAIGTGIEHYGAAGVPRSGRHPTKTAGNWLAADNVLAAFERADAGHSDGLERAG